jgi:hypothetical protein
MTGRRGEAAMDEANKLLAGIGVERTRREQGSADVDGEPPHGVHRTAQIGGHARPYWLSSTLRCRTEINAVFYLLSARPLSVCVNLYFTGLTPLLHINGIHKD